MGVKHWCDPRPWRKGRRIRWAMHLSLFLKTHIARGVSMHRIAERFFWGLMWFMLALGVVAGVLCWGVLTPDAPRWLPWPLGIGVWARALGLRALVLRLISSATDL